MAERTALQARKKRLKDDEGLGVEYPYEVSAKYSLEAALTLRRACAELRAQELNQRATETRAAARELARAEQLLELAVASDREFETEQQRALELGGQRAGDLSRAAEVRRFRELERTRHIENVRRFHERVAEASRTESRAAEALNQAISERRAVERHREGWDLARAAEREQAADEQATERWSAERLGSRQR